MKKNSKSSRVLALVLALVMILSLIPVGVFAANVNDLYAGDTGIKTETMGNQSPINWPVKIYDYLDDGILFESAQANITDASVARVDNYYYDIKYNYGGGDPAPIITEGTDLTGNAWYSSTTAPWRTVGFANRFKWSKISPDDYDHSTTTTDDDPFVNPRFLKITPNTSATSGSYAFCLKNFKTTTSRRDTAYLKLSKMRYMVLTYRATGFSNESDLAIWLEYTNSSGYVTYLKPTVELDDSGEWKSVVIDMKSILGDTNWSTYKSTNLTAVYLYMPSLDSDDRLDLSHVAFFNKKAQAKQFGIDAEAFSNNPGELLKLNPTITTNSGTKTKLPLVERPGYVLSTHQQYTSGRNTITDSGTYYGLNLTTKQNLDGDYTNGYASDTYYSWKTATSITVPYTTTTLSYTMNQMTVTEMTETQGQKYVRLTNGGGNTGNSRIILTKFWEDTKYTESNAPQMKNARYVVLVYRTHGLASGSKYGFWANGNNGSGTAYVCGMGDPSKWTSIGSTTAYNLNISEELWTYSIVDLYDAMDSDSDMVSMYNNGKGRLKRVGMYLPTLTSGKSLDLAYVAYFDNATVADYFGADASAYMNGGKTVDATKATVTLSDRNWSGGNNLAFGLLYSSQGGGWSGGIYGGSSTNTSNGYDTWRVGYDLLNGNSFSSNTTRRDIYGKAFTAYYTVADSKTAATPTSGTTNNIFYVSPSADDGNSTSGFDMSKLDLDGYQLLTTLTQGGMTAGLLEGTLENGMPVYRQEAVEYVAMVLYRTLTIPQYDADGDYNYNFVMGAPNSALGGFDLNGDGKIGRADLNGDNYAETDENCLDVATALRCCLGIRFTLGAQRGTTPAMGTYAQTAKKNLIGEFKTVRNNITTCMDAAYFLLNSLFYDNSYNQLQDDYSYLRLEHVTMDNDKQAYVFDAGYTTGTGYAEGTVIGSNSTYESASQSAIKYDPNARLDADGNVIKGEGAIYMENVNSKDKFYFLSNSTTTRFPFLPVTDAEGDFAGATTSNYFYDDGVMSLNADKGTYVNRNFNYVMACNGEFVYHEKDGLFFEFEGDDDVYLFINGQLVLDLGGAHSISNESFEVNNYVEWAEEIVAKVEAANGDLDAAGVTAAEYARAQKLNLTEGEICQFDFYYMERHGYGANCRIVTNMRVTDPALRTDKTASQTIEKKIDEETVEKIVENIPYGGVVDYEKPIAYYFKMTNSGNTKLYNLTFEDKDIGVSLDYINGLQVTGTYQGESVNGSYVLDSENGMLEAKDLTADVVGYKLVGEGNGHYKKNGPGDYSPEEGGMYDYAEVLDIKFADNQALINFLKTLDAEGTDDTKVDAELTQNGAGLWVDASVTIKGIHFYMNDDQVKSGYFDNTVNVSATTRTDPNEPGNITRKSSDNHRVYISGAPAYFQWSGHDLYLTEELIFTDATKAAGNGTGGQLSQYGDFFKKANNKVSNIESVLCDSSGKILDNQLYGDLVQWESDNKGLLINYKESGTQAFYLYMYLKDSLRADSTQIQDGEFAIVRVTIHVPRVENSTFVLDYGLKSENLDTYGQLFKDDDLLSNVAGATAKLMAVTKDQPTYLDYTNNKSGSYNRINFNPFQLSSTTRLFTHTDEKDSYGAWTVNLDIPESGRVITYNANTGSYSLTDIGTVTIHANVPFTWDDVYLYWWYDNGISNDTFPGKEMTRTRAGKFVMDIPADVPHVIISRPELDDEGNAVTDENGNPKYIQTADLNLSMGKEAWIELSGKTNIGGNLAADVYYSMATSTMHAVVPEGWGDVYLYYWNETGVEGVDYPAWPGAQATDPDGDGRYSLTEIPGNITHVIVNNGGVRNEGKQTNSLSIYAGRETTITVKNSYQASVTTSTDERQTFTVRVNVPEDWTSANLYYWNNGTEGDFGNGWPGTAMTKNEDGTYSLEVPNKAEYVIVNSDNGQTVDLPVVSGKEVTLTLGAKDGAKFTASYEYAGTFTLNVTVPDSWVANDETINLYYWNNFGAASGAEWPGEAMTKNGDGTYSITVPNYANYIIVNNGSVQTGDYKLPATSANMISLEVNEDKSVTVVNEATVAVDVTVPNNWGGVYLYYWNETGVEGVDYPAWPGTAMFSDGNKYELTIPGSMTGMIVNAGEERDLGNQTNVLSVPDSGTASVEIREARATTSTMSNSTITAETFKVTVKAPEGWTNPNLYYWQDGGTDFDKGWPGTSMVPNEDGTYSLDIPAAATHVIVNHPAMDEEGNPVLDGDGNQTYAQTGNISVVSGKDVLLTVNEDASVQRTYEGTYKVTVTVPASWGNNINLYYCNEAMGITEGWPGVAMTKNDDGTFSLDVPNYATKLVVNNVVDGVGTQSEDLWVGASTGATIQVAEYYNASVSYPQTSIMAHAMVPDHWVANGETIYLYSWNSSGQENAKFPGVPMTAEEGELEGWYSVEMYDTFTNIIISNGSHDGHKQSINLTVRTGLEPWITVNDYTIVEENVTRYTASVNNGNSAEEEGFFFTPIRFMDDAYKLWMAISVHAENVKPSALGSDIDVHDEVQMYKQITVLPANVVYYEDDFTGISYDESSGNSFDKIGGGSGSLKQSVDQDMVYGQDPYYQSSNNGSYSGNSLQKIQITNDKEFATFTFSGTGFEIIGNTNAYDTGMIMVKVYDAENYAKYKAGTISSIEPYMQVPVINEYDNGANGGTDSIEQVPVVRVSSITKLKTNADGTYVRDDLGNYQYETLGYGKYTVEISGLPVYHFCGAPIKTVADTPATCLSSGEGVSTCSGCGESWSHKLAATGHRYSDGKCVACGEATPYSTGSCKHNFEATRVDIAPSCVDCGAGVLTCTLCDESYEGAIKPAGHVFSSTVSKTNPSGYTYDALVCSICADPFVPAGRHYNGVIGVDEAYLYIDGVRVFQPYNSGVSDLYRPNESGAAFSEIRDMIANKQMFVISTEIKDEYDDTTKKNVVTISGGMNTWTENRIGYDSNGNSWVGNTVADVTEYLYAGPNNEVYMAAGQNNPSTLAFYVKENVKGAGELQVAIRGIDYGTFFGNPDCNLNATLLLGVVDENGLYGWKPLAEVISGTEQYYTIPYTECPVDENGRYQVMLQIANTTDSYVTGMVSFSSLKTNGLTIPTLSGSNFELTYSYDGGSLIDPISGEALDTEEYVNFAMIRKQMNSNVLVLDEPMVPGDTDSDDTGSDNTGSDNTGSDNTGSDNTGSDNTGSDNTGSDNTGSDNTGSDNTGSDNTGSDNTGSDNTGSDNTGSDDTGSDNTGTEDETPGTGDVSLIGLMVIMIVALMTVVFLPKKAFRF